MINGIRKKKTMILNAIVPPKLSDRGFSLLSPARNASITMNIRRPGIPPTILFLLLGRVVNYISENQEVCDQ